MENYKKLRLIGRGAYGTVYLCTRDKDKKSVIIKEIPVDQMTIEERQASLNEAKVLSMLNHPNIISYFENFLEDKLIVIAMEYAKGGTLYEYLQQQKEKLLEEKMILHYFGQMVYALQYVHSKSILHRDLKSQNILLNGNKSIVKIGDFGISKVLSSKSKAYTVVGTPCYISPELCEGKPYNQKSDIWALGCILYELITLKRPFEADTLPALIMKIMKGSYDPVPDIYSKDLKKLLISMLHLDPNQRPTAAQIMCQPIMINVIFRLYVDIGSIPCIKKSDNLTATILSTFPHNAYDKLDNNINFMYINEKNKNPISAKESFIWYLDKGSNNAILLPTQGKRILTVSLGPDQKFGILDKGLMSWQENYTDNSTNSSPSYIVKIIEDRFSTHILSVVCGIDFTVCLSDSGVVSTFGKASSGCLAHSLENDVLQPQIVRALFGHNITSIACGLRHVLAISDENIVFAWGYGDHGCLGLGKTAFYALPQIVPISDHYKPESVYCGPDSSFIIMKDLTVLACGNNRHNKLALDSSEGHKVDEARVFTRLHSEPLNSTKIKAIASGKSHTVFLSVSGQVYTVGSNHNYQLGWTKIPLDYSLPALVQYSEDKICIDIACNDYYSITFTKDNSLYFWGKLPKVLFNQNAQDSIEETVQIFHDINVLSMSCYSEGTLIHTQDQFLNMN